MDQRVRGVLLLVETCMDNTNIVKMNDNRWFQYDNDDNVCEKIFFSLLLNGDLAMGQIHVCVGKMWVFFFFWK